VLHSRVLADDGPFAQLQGQLMSMIVLPYLGPRAARAELSASPPLAPVPAQRRRRGRRGDPLDGLSIRLTYRTVRVLGVIAEHPGASNRQIAEASGVSDQGQISKLLARLARLELVENRGEGQERGAPNAWHLTARGARVEHTARPR